MCLMCEEEDLYFLYLEQRERAEKLARGETSPPDPGWLWPSFATGQAPAAAASQPAATAESTKPRNSFVCDTPE